MFSHCELENPVQFFIDIEYCFPVLNGIFHCSLLCLLLGRGGSYQFQYKKSCTFLSLGPLVYFTFLIFTEGDAM